MGCTRALCVLVIFWTARGKTHLDPPEFIAMDFLIDRTDHSHCLRLGARQIDAGIVSRHNRDAAPYASEAIGVAHAAFCAGLLQTVAIAIPVVQCEQATYPLVERLGECIVNEREG